MGRFENFTPPTLGSDLTTAEITLIEDLAALANSAAGEFIRKSAGSLVNATLSETIALSGLSDVSITSPTDGQVLTYDGSGWVNEDAAAGGGSGTVTTLSVVTVNGVSGTVANATTTPAITLTLGDITPSSVVSTGVVRPSANDGAALGSTTVAWSDLYLANGAGILFYTSPGVLDAYIGHSSNLLTVWGADFNFDAGSVTTVGPLIIDADGAGGNNQGSLVLGDGQDVSVSFNGTDLLILTDGVGASGIILDSEDDTFELKGSGVLQATFDTNGLNLVTGDAYYINAISVLNATTLGSGVIASSLTSLGTLTAIELGHATDTTLSRVSAGVVAIEGVNILTTAGGTLTGNITLGEGADPATIGIVIDNSMSADERYSGITVPGTAGATISFGDICYLDVTAAEWLLADASAASTAGDVVLGICVDASTDGVATSMLLMGTVRSAAFPASIALGAPVYISETAGDVTATAPVTTDSVMRRVGFAVTVEPNTIYFNPSSDYVTHT